MSAQARSFVGLILLDLGLGLWAGLFAAVGAPLTPVGIVLERSWARAVVFAVGITIACGWLYAALSWD
ncbi:MAG: hypothetical protein OXI41_13985 [Chloroflexota bacterium]|nr:hypothetical protein [Chloroflexota bacterium]